ncbi:MAG TPA: class I SAM-dependent methyltransferase [Desulfosporosinus sp.]|nr:class I SAM-dependent methyltransferase [Desulfosporosinus sp.]
MIDDANRYIKDKFHLTSTKQRIGIPGFTRDDMARLFGELGYKTGAEIGVREGKFSETLCKSNPDVKLYCIDLWRPYEEYVCSPQFANHDKNYDRAKKRLSQYNCEFIPKSSTDAVKDFADNSLDFIYIDANHKFEYVVADLAAWYPKVRNGGIISGHDYKKFMTQHPTIGVKQAVDGFCSAYQIIPYYIFQTRCADRHMPNRCGSFMWVKGPCLI